MTFLVKLEKFGAERSLTKSVFAHSYSDAWSKAYKLAKAGWQVVDVEEK